MVAAVLLHDALGLACAAAGVQHKQWPRRIDWLRRHQRPQQSHKRPGGQHVNLILRGGSVAGGCSQLSLKLLALLRGRTAIELDARGRDEGLAVNDGSRQRLWPGGLAHRRAKLHNLRLGLEPLNRSEDGGQQRAARDDHCGLDVADAVVERGARCACRHRHERCSNAFGTFHPRDGGGRVWQVEAHTRGSSDAELSPERVCGEDGVEKELPPRDLERLGAARLALKRRLGDQCHLGAIPGQHVAVELVEGRIGQPTAEPAHVRRIGRVHRTCPWDPLDVGSERGGRRVGG